MSGITDNGEQPMKKTAIILILWALMICVFSSNVCAEEVITAPVVQYKLIDHDRIALRWDAVEGADGYYIYRTDVKTGKTFRYPSVVNSTENTIGRLSPDTEYIFSVAPIKKNDKVTVGKRSSGTKLTTPKEWYYDADYEIDSEKKKMTSYYYRTDYANTKKEEITLGDIKAVDEIIYYDGWYYVIGDYDAITANKSYPWEVYSGDNCQQCVARIKADGTCKEILLDFFSAEGWGYNYQITNDAIYILSYHKDYDLNHNDMERYYSFPEDCWLKKVSLKTGKIDTLISSRYINWFYWDNGYIYYEYDNTMTLTDEIYFTPVYATDWHYCSTGELVEPKEYNNFYYRMKDNGQETTIIGKDIKDDIAINSPWYIENDLIVFHSGKKIYV